jgi:hypothetical protein
VAGPAGRLTRLFAILPALVLLGAVPSRPVDALAGRYSERFRNALVTGEEYWSENIVEVVPVDARHAYVRIDLHFFNGHVCGLSGIAKAEGDALVYREPKSGIANGECALTIRRKGNLLSWNNEGTCKSYCGARGSFLTDGVAWRSRRPITYLKRLRASEQYRTALAEWKSR